MPSGENARRDSLLASIDRSLGGIEKHLKTLAENSKKRQPMLDNGAVVPPDPFPAEPEAAESGKDDESKPPSPSPFPQHQHPYFRPSTPGETDG